MNFIWKCRCHGNDFVSFEIHYILHFYISLWTHVPNFKSIDQKLREELDPQDFCMNFIQKMLLPWQRNSQLWRTIYLALLYIIMDLCTKFQVNWSKTEGGVRSTRFLHEFHSKNAVAMATHFPTLTKNISCTSTYHYGPMYQISSQLIKNWGRSLIHKILQRTDRPTARRPPGHTVIPIYPLTHLVWAGV